MTSQESVKGIHSRVQWVGIHSELLLSRTSAKQRLRPSCNNPISTVEVRRPHSVLGLPDEWIRQILIVFFFNSNTLSLCRVTFWIIPSNSKKNNSVPITSHNNTFQKRRVIGKKYHIAQNKSRYKVIVGDFDPAGTVLFQD